MLFVKYDDYSDSHVARFLNHNPIILLKRSLQARASTWWQKRKRALRFASCKGAVTVETALVLPVFLCAVCGLILMGSLMLTEAKIQYALSKTADIYAARKAMEMLSEEGGGQSKQKESALPEQVKNAAGFLLKEMDAQAVFTSVYEDSPMDAACIYGGRTGIILFLSSDEDAETVKISAQYRLKIDLPFLGKYTFARRAAVRQRIFSGYTEHRGGDGESEGGVVYVTENGSVYHTSLSCTHICLRISGDSAKRILEGKQYQACDKCIQDGSEPSVLYVTKYGDKYHSSLGCSGLKRTVRTIPKEEAEGMRMCSRCAGKN